MKAFKEDLKIKLSPKAFFDLSHFKHAALFQNDFYVWQAISNIEKYIHTLSHKIEVDVPAGVYLINPESISIGKGTELEPGAYIKGPCVIGENCSIRHGAYIRGNVITGNRCVIGHTTEVKNSIFLDNAHAAHFAYIGDSILGNHTNLGAGVKCANLKLDNTVIHIHLDGKKITTGMRKFGAIVGDRAQLGCNSVTNPGTLIGKNAKCYPCVNFGGIVPDDKIIRSDSKSKIF